MPMLTDRSRFKDTDTYVRGHMKLANISITCGNINASGTV